jgi:hypothetical protein
MRGFSNFERFFDVAATALLLGLGLLAAVAVAGVVL